MCKMNSFHVTCRVNAYLILVQQNCVHGSQNAITGHYNAKLGSALITGDLYNEGLQVCVSKHNYPLDGTTPQHTLCAFR